jgi:hypothetical protein
MTARLLSFTRLRPISYFLPNPLQPQKRLKCFGFGIPSDKGERKDSWNFLQLAYLEFEFCGLWFDRRFGAGQLIYIDIR